MGRSSCASPQRKDESFLNNATFDEVTHEFLAAFKEKFFGAWAMRSGEAVAKLCTEDVVWIDPAAAQAALNGPDEVAQFVDYLYLGFPDARFTEDGDLAISRDGKTAYAPFRMTGTNSGPSEVAGIVATGKTITVLGVDSYRFRGGLIARYRAYVDMLDVMRQLGLAPER